MQCANIAVFLFNLPGINENVAYVMVEHNFNPISKEEKIMKQNKEKNSSVSIRNIQLFLFMLVSNALYNGSFKIQITINLHFIRFHSLKKKSYV